MNPYEPWRNTIDGADWRMMREISSERFSSSVNRFRAPSRDWSNSDRRLFRSLDLTVSCRDALLGSPLVLGFYAVLAASTMLGLTIAHVQISTRLICSSCPALYWYLAVVIERSDSQRFFPGGEVVLLCATHPNNSRKRGAKSES